MKLFTYGTLRRGEKANYMLEGATFVGEDTISNVTKIDYLPWPALLKGGDDTVVGEVYDVPDNLWGSLDTYEGAPDLYQREEVTLDSGTKSQVYFFVNMGMLTS